jgi:FeS cluster assembly scaffold protein NifU
MLNYNDVVLDHFRNPRNMGKMEDADAVGEQGSAVCGDMMWIYLKVEDDKIIDVSFETFGCGAAIASSSMVTELVKGKTLDEALKISSDDIVDALGGLPEPKVHCSVLGVDALHKAIENYRKNQK